MVSLTALALVLNLVGNAQSFELFGINFFEKKQVETPTEGLQYTPELSIISDNVDLKKILETNSLLLSLKNDLPLGTVGLLSRARSDFERLLGTLYERGHYAGLVSISINGQPLQSLSVTETLNEPVNVMIEINSGEQFFFGDITVHAPISKIEIDDILEFNQLIGEKPAFSDHILRSEQELLETVRNAGFPFAKIRDRQVTADHATKVLDVALRIESGPKATFGKVSVIGAKRLKPDFVQRIAGIPTGKAYSQKQLDKARERVAKLNAIGTVVATPQPIVGQSKETPIVFEVSERKRRVIGGEASFASVDGIGTSLFWEHRNLFGRAERLRLEAGVAGFLDVVADDDTIGDDFDANFSASLSQPGIFDAYNLLDTLVFAKQESPEAFTAQSFGLQSILSREVSKSLKISGGIRAECIEVEDVLVDDKFCPISAPLSADYDVRDDKNEPTKGFLFSANATPSYDARNGTTYASFTSRASTYYGFGDGPKNSKRVVLAGLAQVGSIVGANIDEVPADRRFLLGGAGLLRGYAYRNVGFTRIDGEAVGGLSSIAGSAEARIRLTDSFGTALFVDAGTVGETAVFGGLEDFSVGVGAGVRYYTSIGAVRADIAVPLNEQEGDDPVAFYLGIGQAF